MNIFSYSTIELAGLGIFSLMLLFCCTDYTSCNADAAENQSSITEVKCTLPDSSLYFRIHVIDEATSRGIPLVKVKAITGVEYYTDSAGMVAFYEPALMNRQVFFDFESDGYSRPRDGFGSTGKSLLVIPGGSATVIMNRDMVAQRLYRITGTGIYHDSVLLGDKTPGTHPLINAGVAGQDSVQTAIYKEHIFWAWGDTTHLRHPLAANFKTTCATSHLPSDGGLDPDVGVDISYYTRGDFVKSMVPLPGAANPYWLYSLLSVHDKEGKERLLARYSKIQAPLKSIERGMIEFNDDKEVFEQVSVSDPDDIIQPKGHPFKVTEKSREYFYFFSTDGLTRAPAMYESVVDISSYESFTCLKERSRFDRSPDQIERSADGSLQYSWKKTTSPIGQQQLGELVSAGHIRQDQRWFRLIDIETGKDFLCHSGSVAFNPFRKRWVMIVLESWGTSLLGEIWYCEADTPYGPWTYARKIVTHKEYNFYNPLQHPYFAKDDGRVIYLEGTYTNMFADKRFHTPRYEYNQIMFKLDLNDERLVLPVAVYQEGSTANFMTFDAFLKPSQEYIIAFYALDRQKTGTVPVYKIYNGEKGTWRLTLRKPEDSGKLCFYALPGVDDTSSAWTTPLYEYHNSVTGEYLYSSAESMNIKGFIQSEKSLCLVWSKPVSFNPLIMSSE